MTEENIVPTFKEGDELLTIIVASIKALRQKS